MAIVTHIHRHVVLPILDVLFPPQCLHCHKPLAFSPPFLCADCQHRLTPIDPQWVKHHVFDRIEQNYLDAIWIAFEFNAIIQTVIHHLKYHTMPAAGYQLGKLLAAQVFPKISFPADSVLIPVPLHPKRQKERGYNQSEKIARGIAAHSELPLLNKVLRRVRNTRSQTRLNRQERQRNVENAFQVKNNNPLPATVILVDDVITTGATINACARVLKAAGIQQVIGMAVATPKDETFAAP